jgi:putative hydrolase of the HAD superfamily
MADPLSKLPWHQIETVLLDMDGTLLDLHFDNYFWQTFLPAEYAKKNGLKLEQALKKVESMYAEKHGLLEWYSVDYWQEQLQLDIMHLKTLEAHRIRFRPFALDFLYFLKDLKVTVALVTNAHPKTLELKMMRADLKPLVPFQFSSHDFGIAKEHPEFWKTFEETFEFQKEKTLFIDDNDSVLNNAQLFGIKHLRSIKWPDSKQSEANQSAYPMIDSFIDVIQ